VYFDRKEIPPQTSLKIPPKHWYQSTKLHCIKYQKTTLKTANVSLKTNAGNEKEEHSALR
jgi:hypothetical protein